MTRFDNPRNTSRRALLACSMLAALLITGVTRAPAAAPATRPAAQAARPVVAAYLASWVATDPATLPLDGLTHLCHAFVKGDADGNLITDEHMPDPALLKAAHDKGVKVLLSVGGSESDAFLGPITADPRAYEKFVAGVLALMDQSGYDGLDVDWEFPLSDASAAGMTKMVERFRKELDQRQADTGRTLLLTRAVGGPWAYTKIPSSVFQENFDYLHVMCYDVTGPWEDVAGHHAPLRASDDPADKPRLTAEALIAHWRDERGMPASKLVMGLPSYGRGFKNVAKYGHIDKNTPDHTVYTYAALTDLERQGWTISHDDNGAAWLTSPDGKEIVGFDDPAGVRMKTDWALEHGLAGVFFWEATQDALPDGTHPLLEAAADEAAKDLK